MLLTAKGQSVRCGVKDIRETNRGAKGVKLLTLAEGDKLMSIAKVVETDEEQISESESLETDPTVST
jgi:DNA gyrase subunit A